MRYLADPTGITVIHDDEVFMVPATDITYPQVRDYLVSQSGRDIERVRALFTQTKEVVLEATTDALAVVDGDASSSEEPYRVTHNDPVSDVVLGAAIRVSHEGGDPEAITAFLRRLEKNPSAASRSQLFAWLAAEGFTITPDGLIVGYKATQTDETSISFGHEPVTVSVPDGEPITLSGHIPYPVGAEVSMDRALVDDNRNSPCSVGLHVGTHAYAVGFGKRIILVLVDPADVVSVPRDANDQKMRVCRLVVLSEHEGERIPQAVMTVPNHEARKEYQSRAENQFVQESSDPYAGDPDYEDIPDAADGLVAIVEEAITIPTEEDDEAVTDSIGQGPHRATALAILDRLNDGPQNKRTLGKRLSAKRRAHLTEALDVLVSAGRVVRDESGSYRLEKA